MYRSAYIPSFKILRLLSTMLLLYSIFTTETYGQEHDTIIANEYYKKARTLGDAASYEQSILNYEKARDHYKAASHWLGYVKSLNGLGACHSLLSKHQDAQNHLQLALSTGLEKLEGEAVVADTYQNLGFDWSRQGNYDQQFENYQKALAIRLKALGETHPKVAQTYSSLSVSLKYRGDYDRALVNANKGLDIHLETLDSNDFRLSQDYTNIGAIYLSKGEYKKAETYFQRALDVMKNASGEQNQFKAIGFSNLGKSLVAQKAYSEAIAAYENALEVLIQLLGEKHAYAGIFYNNLGAAWLKNDNPSKALEYHKKAEEIFSAVLSKNHPYMAATYINKGKCHANEKGPEALDFLLKGLSIQEQVLGTHHPDYVQTCNTIGLYFLDQKQWETAIGYFQKGLAGMSIALDPTDPYTNPSIDAIGAKNVVLEVLANKGSAQFALYRASENGMQLEGSMATFQTALELIDRLKFEITSTISKREFIEKTIPIYERAIAVSFELFEVTKDPKFLKQAYVYSEKSKSFLLLQELSYAQVKKYAGIPDSIIKSERDFKLQSVFYEGELHKALQKKDTSKTKLYREKLLDARTAMEEIKKNIELKYTQYHKLKYSSDSISLAETQSELLEEGELLLEFFVGEDHIYLFSITQEEFQTFSIEKNNQYEQLIGDFRKATTNQNLILEGSSKNKSLFAESAYGLYELLLQKALSLLKQPIHKIIVVPDGKLSYLNFETFLTSLPKDTTNFRYKDLDYLLKSYRISYAYSTSFLKNTATSRIARDRSRYAFGGFAPAYPNGLTQDDETSENTATGPLPGAEQEVGTIAETLKGKAFVGSRATEKTFKETAHQYQILHLAMHGLLDDSNPMFSKLSFSPADASKEDGFLNAAEIYNLELNADLAVLSACESGYGNIQKGEGMMSLSRAFAYAGCPSLVASLWKVPDGATVQPMVHFYDNLERELPIDEALRNAKLDYLQNIGDPLYEHPFYWSGFVVHGNTQPLSMVSSNSSTFIFITLVLLVGLLTFFWYKKRKVKQRAI